MPRAPDPDCPECRGTGWVCEAHTWLPSDCASPDHPLACHCGAPGEPCDLCYPFPDRLNDPPLLRGMRITAFTPRGLGRPIRRRFDG